MRLEDLVELDSGAPTVDLALHHASMRETAEDVGESRVLVGMRGHNGMEVLRDPPRITLSFIEPVSAHALVHPVLTIPMSILARWRGDVTLHAGAFAANGAAWAVIGGREAGKSTMLATVARAGCPIVADDLLTIDAGEVWSGPQCVDLRPDVAERYGARSIGEVGGRVRYRLSTPPSPPRLPLKGIFLLDWHEARDVALTELQAGERLKLLYDQEYIALLGPADPNRILDLMELPAWRLSRPRDWAATDAAVSALLEAAQA
jgi:hypothetical protein